MAEHTDLSAAVTELDDEYLKVMLLLAVRRSQSEEPRRSGFWHAVAVILAGEQEKRRGVAEFDRSAVATSIAVAPGPEIEAVLQELRQEMASLEAEVRESTGGNFGFSADQAKGQ
ncbi:MAG: hypothetical protein ACRD2W_12235 [Acidimicrobiales bacterium]